MKLIINFLLWHNAGLFLQKSMSKTVNWIGICIWFGPPWITLPALCMYFNLGQRHDGIMMERKEDSCPKDARWQIGMCLANVCLNCMDTDIRSSLVYWLEWRMCIEKFWVWIPTESITHSTQLWGENKNRTVSFVIDIPAYHSTEQCLKPSSSLRKSYLQWMKAPWRKIRSILLSGVLCRKGEILRPSLA